MALRSNYGIIGHMSLLQNPVMKLSEQDFQKCRTDMLRLRERMEDSGHLFREEMIGHLLMAPHPRPVRHSCTSKYFQASARKNIFSFAAVHRPALSGRIHPKQGFVLLCFEALHYASLPVRNMQKGERKAGDILDNSFHPTGNRPAALPQRTYAGRDRKPHEFFVRFLFKSLRAKMGRGLSDRIQKQRTA